METFLLPFLSYTGPVGHLYLYYFIYLFIYLFIFAFSVSGLLLSVLFSVFVFICGYFHCSLVILFSFYLCVCLLCLFDFSFTIFHKFCFSAWFSLFVVVHFCLSYLSWLLLFCLHSFTQSLISFCHAMQFSGSLFPSQRPSLSSCGGNAESKIWTTKEIPEPGNINWWEFSQGSPSWYKVPAPHNHLQVSVLDTWCQTIGKTGTYPAVDRKSKVTLSSQTS